MTTTLVWQKDENTKTPNANIQAFLAGRDVELDRTLLPFDIQATIAHVKGLNRIDVLEDNECALLCDGLRDLAGAFKSGEFILDSRFEDGHSAIEWYLFEKLGEVGRKVHLGRSRNDQIQTAMRLYLLDELQSITILVCKLAAAFLTLAEQEKMTPIPGYTHLQRAVPSTVGLWLAAFAESFIDNADLLNFTARWINTSPLGTAAGYGVNLSLDRAGVAQELGFNRIQINPMYAQNCRGQFEFQTLASLWQVMQGIRRFAWDISLYTSAEFDFVHLPDELTTGSSIMPNKRNPDVVELLRGSMSIISGGMTEIQQIISLPSGYHRDLQLTKEPTMRAMVAARRSITITLEVIKSLEFNHKQMHAAINSTMYATDRAVELAIAGTPFRDAYRKVASEFDQLSDRTTPEKSAKARTSPGACADLQLEKLQYRLAIQQDHS